MGLGNGWLRITLLRITCSESVVECGRTKAYTNDIMVKDCNIEYSSSSEICAGVKKLGFAAFERVRLYGEEFELLSDPFPEADGIAIRVKSKRDARLRTVQLPATIVQSVRSRKAA